VHSIADALDTPPGAVVNFVAQFHEGSHEGCDKATE
jgi:hypothetical protein